jgi:outer membrane protein TolC
MPEGSSGQESGQESCPTPGEQVHPCPQGELLTLEQAAQAALDRSRDLRDARFGLNVAEEQVSEAWGSVFPSVDLSANYTRNVTVSKAFLPAVIFDPAASPNELIPVQFGADNLWNLSIDLDQPLFDARAFIGVGTAGRFRNLQEESVRSRSQSVVTRVRLAYYDLLLAQEQYRLTENSVRRVRESLTETRALNRAGLASDYDVLRLEVELANLEPNLRRAQNAEAQARRQLGVEMALEDLESVRVSGSLALMILDDREANSPENEAVLSFNGLAEGGDLSSEDLVRRAFDTRSDLRQLTMTEDLRRAELRVEQVEYLPKVSLFGTYGINAQENGSPDFFGEERLRAYARQVGISVSVPLFTGFQRDARVDQKRAALRQAETQTLFAMDQAETQVKALVEQVDEARLRADGQRLAVSQAQRGFEIARAQYREGLGSQLELTDAEVALRQSEFNYAQAVYDYLVARARLDEAIGLVPLVDVPLRTGRADADGA